MKHLTISKHSFFAVGAASVLLLSMALPAMAAAPAVAGSSDLAPIAMTINAGQNVSQSGTLNPGQSVWYSVTVNDPHGRYEVDANHTGNGDINESNTPNEVDRPPLDMSLFVTPGSGNYNDHVNMKLYTGVNAVNAGTDFGAGNIVPRTSDFHGDPNVGQQNYSGWVDSGIPTLIQITNNNSVPISYDLFTANMTNVTLGGAAQTAPVAAQMTTTTSTATGAAKLAAPAVVPSGANSNSPIALSINAGQDVSESGTLQPGQSVWYSVTVNSSSSQYEVDNNHTGNGDINESNTPNELERPPLDLSLFVTPGSGNHNDHVNMSLYAGQSAVNAGITFGAGNLVPQGSDFKGDPNVGQQTYSGWVDNGIPTLIQITNNNNVPISYHLFTSNMTNVSLGAQSSAPSAVVSK
jgi:stress response protein SCP2